MPPLASERSPTELKVGLEPANHWITGLAALPVEPRQPRGRSDGYLGACPDSSSMGGPKTRIIYMVTGANLPIIYDNWGKFPNCGSRWAESPNPGPRPGLVSPFGDGKSSDAKESFFGLHAVKAFWARHGRCRQAVADFSPGASCHHALPVSPVGTLVWWLCRRARQIRDEHESISPAID